MRQLSTIIKSSVLLLLVPVSAMAMCWPCPCVDCEIQSFGQLNWVNFDRETETIRLVPNIRIVGPATDFALIVPTPTVPALEPVEKDIWDEAIALTAAVTNRRSRGSGVFGCGVFSPDVSDPLFSRGGDEVIIVGQSTVGSFIATTIQSSSAQALVGWLNENNYQVTLDDTDRFAPYAEAGWVFTAMRLDTENVEIPPAWDTNVDPVMFTYRAEEFEVPLPVLAINRGPRLPMTFYIVEDQRVDLAGFTVSYANRISKQEYAAIESRHPNLAPLLSPGKFLTRLDRTFLLQEPMDQSLFVTRAETQEEFRRVVWFSLWNSFPAMLAALMVMFIARPVVKRLMERGRA